MPLTPGVEGIRGPASQPITGVDSVQETHLEQQGPEIGQKEASDAFNESSLEAGQKPLTQPESAPINNPALAQPSRTSSVDATEKVQTTDNVFEPGNTDGPGGLNGAYNGFQISTMENFSQSMEKFIKVELGDFIATLSPELQEMMNAVIEILETFGDGEGVSATGDGEGEIDNSEDGLFAAYRDTSVGEGEEGAPGAAGEAKFGQAVVMTEEEIAKLEGMGIPTNDISALAGKGYTAKEIEYVAGVKGTAPKVIEQGVNEYRFAGNYLKVMAAALALIHGLKAMMASIEGNMLKTQMEAEKNNLRSQMDTLVKKMKAAFLERAKAKRLKGMENKGAKWVLFAVQATITVVMIAVAIAVTIATLGTMGPVAIAIVVTALVVMTVVTALMMLLQFLSMIEIDVVGEIAEAMGIPQDKLWLVKIALAAVILICCIGLAIVMAGAAAAMAGMALKQALMMIVLSIAIMTATVGPQMLSYSNVAFEVIFRLAQALGMDEEAAAQLAMILSMIAMIVIMLVAMLMAVVAMQAVAALNPASMAGKGAAQSIKMAQQAEKSAADAAKQAGKTRPPGRVEIGKANGRAATRFEGKSSASTWGKVKNAPGNLTAKMARKMGLYKHYGAKEGRYLYDGKVTAAEQKSIQQGGIPITEINADLKASASKPTTAKHNQAIDQIQKQLNRIKQIFEVDGFVQGMMVVGEIAAILQIIVNIVQGIANIQKGILIKEQAELQFQMQVLQVFLDFIKNQLPTFQRAREGILDDMQNGMMKLATELHKQFENAVTSASQASTERNNAIRS